MTAKDARKRSFEALEKAYKRELIDKKGNIDAAIYIRTENGSLNFCVPTDQLTKKVDGAYKDVFIAYIREYLVEQEYSVEIVRDNINDISTMIISW